MIGWAGSAAGRSALYSDSDTEPELSLQAYRQVSRGQLAGQTGQRRLMRVRAVLNQLPYASPCSNRAAITCPIAVSSPQKQESAPGSLFCRYCNATGPGRSRRLSIVSAFTSSFICSYLTRSGYSFAYAVFMRIFSEIHTRAKLCCGQTTWTAREPLPR